MGAHGVEKIVLKIGAYALPLKAYKTLTTAYHDRCAKKNFRTPVATFSRLYDVPGDGHCVYHALACGIMDTSTFSQHAAVTSLARGWLAPGASPLGGACHETHYHI